MNLSAPTLKAGGSPLTRWRSSDSNEGLPLVDAPRHRGCLVVKFLFRDDAPPLRGPRAARDAVGRQRRVFETLSLAPRRVACGAGRGRFVVGDSFQPRRPQPQKYRAPGPVPFDAPPAEPRILAGPDCRVCAASLRVVDGEATPVDDFAAAMLGRMGWYYLKWAAELAPRLGAAPYAAPSPWTDARIRPDRDAKGYVDPATLPKKAPRAARAPAPAFVVVDTERLEGMDDDMKERTRARKARERARVDREIALEKRDIARPEQSKFPRDYEVVFDSVNVREAPRLTAKTVGALPRGSVVTAARAQGNWVQLEAANGNAGRWIMVDGDELGLPALLRPVAAATSPPPPPPPGDDEPRLFRSAATERPRFETIDDRRRLCTVLGTKGAAVRKGPEIDSAKVTVLDYLAVCAYTGRQAVTADGRRRVEIDAPVHGWMSLKFLGPEGYE